MRTAFMLIPSLLLSATIASAAVYQCPDGKGGRVFQNMPCVTTSEAPMIPHVATPQERGRQQADDAVASIGQRALPVNYQQQIDGHLAGILKDPDSRKVTYLGSYGSAACGMVNAKNSLGGYTGNKIFLAIFPVAAPLRQVYIFSEKDMNQMPFLSHLHAQLLQQCGVAAARH